MPAHAQAPSADDGVFLVYMPSILRPLTSYPAQIGCMSEDEARDYAPAAIEELDATHLVVSGLERQSGDLATHLVIGRDNTVVLAKGDCAVTIKEYLMYRGKYGDTIRIVMFADGPI